MIFQHTWRQVLDGTKTQTRRPVKPGEMQYEDFRTRFAITQHLAMHWYPYTKCAVGIVSSPNDIVAVFKPKWCIGKSYAVQPGRGQKAVGRIRITNIRQEDVRQIDYVDLIAEGYWKFTDFYKVWTKMHDKPFQFTESSVQENKWVLWADRHWQSVTGPALREMLLARPDERYQAWVLEFELVKDQS